MLSKGKFPFGLFFLLKSLLTVTHFVHRALWEWKVLGREGREREEGGRELGIVKKRGRKGDAFALDGFW